MILLNGWECASNNLLDIIKHGCYSILHLQYISVGLGLSLTLQLAIFSEQDIYVFDSSPEVLIKAADLPLELIRVPVFIEVLA